MRKRTSGSLLLQVPNRSLSDLHGHSTAWHDLSVYLPRTVLGHSTSLLKCSLTELLASGAEVHLTFNRKLEASVTWLCCAKTVRMLFCSSPASGEVQAEAQCLGFGGRSKLIWHTLCLSLSHCQNYLLV